MGRNLNDAVPLTAVDEAGEVDAFGIRFVMEQRGERVRCHVFRSAITATAEHAVVSDEDLLALFQKGRSMFERLASNLFDAGHRNPWIEAVWTVE